MLKMVTVTLIILLIFSICSAPSVSDRQMQEKIKAITEKLNYDKQFELFVEHLGLRESGNKAHVINSIGCMGRWQIAPSTLQCLGYDNITPQRFRQDPHIFPEELQRQILIELFKLNEIALKDYISNYEGLVIGGVTITKSGILAASHLGGPGSVKKYLLTMGKKNPKDLNGTTIKQYLKDFSMYKI